MRFSSKLSSLALALAVALVPSCAMAGRAIVAIDPTYGPVQAAGGVGIRARDVATAAAAEAGVRASNVFDSISDPERAVLAVFDDDSLTDAELAEKLVGLPGIISAAPDRKIRIAATPNDPKWTDGSLWGMKRIGAEAAWNIEKGKGTVYVAVIDTGVTPHPDLEGRIATEHGKCFVDPDHPTTDTSDGNGHGTHVAGTIAAQGNNSMGVVGVCWDGVKIIPLKIFDASGSGTEASELAAIDEVVRLIKDEGVNIAAVNLSLGGFDSTSPTDMIKKQNAYYLAFKALADLEHAPVIAVAASNEAIEVGAPTARAIDDPLIGKIAADSYVYPASLVGIDTMVVVGGIQQGDAAYVRSNWSSERVHVAAPAVKILSTRNGRYEALSGTSMATPHAAGTAGLIASRWPGISAKDIIRRMLLTAESDVVPEVPSSEAPQMTRDRRVCAYGVLRADRAVAATAAEIDAAEAKRQSDVEAKLATLAPSQVSVVVEAAGVSSILLGKTAQASLMSPIPGASRYVLWKSSAPKVADVDDMGTITAKSTGTANISAHVGGKQIASRTITVSTTPRPRPTPTPTPSKSGGGGGGCAAGAAISAAMAILVIRRRSK